MFYIGRVTIRFRMKLLCSVVSSVWLWRMVNTIIHKDDYLEIQPFIYLSTFGFCPHAHTCKQLSSVDTWVAAGHLCNVATSRLSSWDFPGGTVVKNPPTMQGTWVRALAREDPTCCGATKPMCHNYWACALEPVSHNYWSLRATSHRNEKPTHRKEE